MVNQHYYLIQPRQVSANRQRSLNCVPSPHTDNISNDSFHVCVKLSLAPQLTHGWSTDSEKLLCYHVYYRCGPSEETQKLCMLLRRWNSRLFSPDSDLKASNRVKESWSDTSCSHLLYNWLLLIGYFFYSMWLESRDFNSTKQLLSNGR